MPRHKIHDIAQQSLALIAPNELKLFLHTPDTAFPTKSSLKRNPLRGSALPPPPQPGGPRVLRRPAIFNDTSPWPPRPGSHSKINETLGLKRALATPTAPAGLFSRAPSRRIGRARFDKPLRWRGTAAISCVKFPRSAAHRFAKKKRQPTASSLFAPAAGRAAALAWHGS